MLLENASRILQNCNYSILLGLKSSDIDAVKSLFANSQNALTDAEIHLLSQQKKGQSYKYSSIIFDIGLIYPL
ncbi:hypothetical protein RRG54_01845 [Mycoplasmopsis felis]|uniref:hypothetical protein n=1 Tax=Mycoplasmopsis felis TaxID=33923 RepID=UPI00300D84ED